MTVGGRWPAAIQWAGRIWPTPTDPGGPRPSRAIGLEFTDLEAIVGMRELAETVRVG
jgi:hypothetical protein